jgi:hypothetical protein
MLKNSPMKLILRRGIKDMPVRCPMCLNDVPKLKSDSHVLPKFFLRPIRDSNGRIRTIDVLKAIVDGKSQDLPKGTYICAGCETMEPRYLISYRTQILKLSLFHTEEYFSNTGPESSSRNSETFLLVL